MADADKTDGVGSASPLRAKARMEQLDLLVRRLDALPALSLIVRDVLAAPADDESCPGALAAILRREPRLAQQLAAAAEAGPTPRTLDALARMIDALGCAAARSALPAMQVIAAFGPTHGRGLDRAAFWRHSLAAAAAAELAAEGTGGPIDPALAFLCGFLHDIGRLALDECLPKSYRLVLAASARHGADIAEIEREVIGADHTLIGRWLCQHWNLPACVQEAVWLHRQPPQAVPTMFEGAALVSIVQFADGLARRRSLGLGDEATPGDDLADLAGRIGLTDEGRRAVEAGLDERMTRYAPLLGLAEPPLLSPPPADGPAAPPRAEPSADQTPSVDAEDFQRQLRAMERLGDFAARIGAATPLPQLCAAVARAFAEAAGFPADMTPPVAAFALPAGGEQAMLAVCGPQDRQAVRFAAARDVSAAPPTAACPAGPLLRGILLPADAWSDLIDPDRYTCLPLIARGRWLGGILLPGRFEHPADGHDLHRTLAPILAFFLSAAIEQAQSSRLAEQLAQTSGRLVEAQEALAQARALATVGEMAAGAGHELNNPLAVIAGRAQLLASRARTKKDRLAAELIVQKAQEISDIATGLMELARPSPPKPDRIAAGKLLEAAKAAFLAEAQPKQARPAVDIDVEADCPPLRADRRQLQEILIELMRNAATAAARPVSIRIAAGPSQGREGAGRVLIRVSDDGAGMDEGTLKAAFTPFFSSRPAGRGRGMGLPRARRQVQANGGDIRLESAPGEGTTAYIELPQAGTEKT